MTEPPQYSSENSDPMSNPPPDPSSGETFGSAPSPPPPPSLPPNPITPPPPPGFPTPPPPPGYANNDEKTWALISHFGGAAGAFVGGGGLGWVAPLVAMLTKGNESSRVRGHAVAALNFQILWAIISFVAVIVGVCLFWLVIPMLLFLTPLVPVVIGVIAGVKANEGQLYRYPMTVNWIK